MSCRCLHHGQALSWFQSTDTPVHLPNDLIRDILVRIPVKSLCRFRCASKGWLDLISDPAFVAAHKSRHAEPLLIAASTLEPSLRLIDMDGNIVRVIRDVGWSPTFISTSSDDLVCVIGDTFDFETNVVRVAGFATSEVLVTRLRGNTWGFGRATPSGEYKVVSLGRGICDVLTVTVGGGFGWRTKQPHPTNTSYHNRPVVVDGVLHLLVRPQLNRDIVVLCFDLESEKWKKGIKGPLDVELRSCNTALGELNGALCMVQGEVWNACTHVWLLRDSEKDIWDKAYTIPLSPTMYCSMMPLRVLCDNRKLLFYLIHKFGGASVLKIYDPSNGTCTDPPKTLDNRGYSIGICSLHLERFISNKIQSC